MQIIVLELVLLTVFAIIILANAIRILREYERGVVFRLGRLIQGGVKGPGLVLLVPIVDKMVKVSLRTVVMDVPPQDIITQDNVSLKVNAVIYFRVIAPQKAIHRSRKFSSCNFSTLTDNAKKRVGQSDLDDLLSQREKINLKLQQIIDAHTGPWGIKVSTLK
jgi:regulator of protease activity HflC (stomatin/prohibitin superfamily)